jgi:putative transposase
MRTHTRALHARKGLSLPTDLTEAEWAVLEPLLPPALPGGRPRKWPLRRIVEAMLYLLRGGWPWWMLPPGFPPATTVQRYFYAWRDSGVLQTINHYLLMDVRVAEGREASPSVGVIDSKSAKTTESGGIRGHDAGKKIKGRKRHILTDTCGYLAHAVVASSFFPDAGSSSGHSPGSTATAALPKTLNAPSKVPPHGSSSPPSNF